MPSKPVVATRQRPQRCNRHHPARHIHTSNQLRRAFFTLPSLSKLRRSSNSVIASLLRHRVPAVFPYRHFVAAGGLISYGPDLLGQYRRAAGYVDRILKGEKPADLPVQAPTKYELVINAKTAKALGIEFPSALLARADEVIE